MYLDLLEDVLLNVHYLEQEAPDLRFNELPTRERRLNGEDHPSVAMTMVGKARLNNVRVLVEQLVAEGVPGDLVEVGVWRGGVGIYMLGVLEAHDDETRTIWLVDSFSLPPPHRNTIDDVRRSVGTFFPGRQDRVRILSGDAESVLPGPLGTLALLRLDIGDAGMQVLEKLYDRLSHGGFVVVDDYGYSPSLASAIDRFLSLRGLCLTKIDWTGVYWRKP